MITADELRALLRYEPDTGRFYWRDEQRRGVKRGRPAGCNSRKGGSRVIGIDGRIYLAHRLAWLYVHGSWPQHDIDHIDGNPDNNRLANLRDVLHFVNCQNRRRATSANEVGLLGVSAKDGKFVALITEPGPEGKTIYLGKFKTPEEAHEAYLIAKRRLHAGCTI